MEQSHCRQILSHLGSPRIPEWVAYPSSGGSSQPGSPELQVDSLPAELSGKLCRTVTSPLKTSFTLSPSSQPPTQLLPMAATHLFSIAIALSLLECNTKESYSMQSFKTDCSTSHNVSEIPLCCCMYLCFVAFKC